MTANTEVASGNGDVKTLPTSTRMTPEPTSVPDGLPEPDLRENALKVLAARYLKKGPDRKPCETPKELFWRVASCIASAEAAYPGGTPETVDRIARAFYGLMASRAFMPNSPTLMNAGREMGMLSACFVVPVEDSIDGIFGAIRATALIQKAGGGTGFSFSRLRPSGDIVHSSGGTTEGPLSFLEVFSAATNAIQQGAFRRGANMGILRVDHPDLIEFIRVKEDLSRLTNYNLSVAVTERYLAELRRDRNTVHQVQNPRTGEWSLLRKKGEDGVWTVGEIWDLICERAWGTGEPGLFFIDRANAANPIRNLGLIEATNPCFAGSARLFTDRGLVPFEELARERMEIRVATDDRAAAIRRTMRRAGDEGGGTAVCEAVATGVTVRYAHPAFLTRKETDVFRLETEEGFEVVATADHKFFTPAGLVPLSGLRPGDEVLVQSGPGVWSSDDSLPPFEDGVKFQGRVARGECAPPAKFTAEVGEILGWMVGDGWIRTFDRGPDRVAHETAGMIFGTEEKRLLAPAFAERIRRWFGIATTPVDRNGTLTLYAGPVLVYWLRSLGVEARPATEKRVPESIFRAPREAVVGFLRALFTADGTVCISSTNNRSCSVRLASSSRALLQDVQLLLLNLGIFSRLYLRRKAGTSVLPDSKRQPREYPTAAQYELILDKVNRDAFARGIGFLVSAKQEKLEAWIETKMRASADESFVARVRAIEAIGVEDVYCTTEPETHSIVANGFVAAQCGEQDLHPWDSCNLGSINLSKFVVEDRGAARFDWDGLRETTHLATRFLDDVIDVNRYPLPEIDQTSKTTRRIGLGVMGFADALFKLDIPYDSEEGCAFGENVMKFLTDEAHNASEALAGTRGVFPAWEGSDWQKRGRRMRNSYATTVAPTGTISIIANCSGGIEPLFSIAFWRQVLDGQRMIEVNEPFLAVARARGFYDPALLEKAAESGSVRHLGGVPEDVKRVFVCAHDVAPEWHVRMQAAFQKHTDAQVSKTINLSHEAAVEDVRRIYEMAIDLGLRGITVYRDGCRDHQPMALKGSLRRREGAPGDAAAEAIATASPLVPVRLPEIMPSLRVRQMTPFGNMHVKIAVDPASGIEREVFSQLGKGGDVANSDLEAICRLLSLFLRCNGTLELAAKQLEGIGSSLTVPSREGRIMSLADGLAKALRRYMEAKRRFGLRALLLGEVDPEALASAMAAERNGGETSNRFKVKCPECSGVLAFEEGCVKCPSCGFSQC